MSVGEALVFIFMCIGFAETMSHFKSVHRKLDALEAINALKGGREVKGYWVGVWIGGAAVFLSINLTIFEGVHPVVSGILAAVIVLVVRWGFDALKESEKK